MIHLQEIGPHWIKVIVNPPPPTSDQLAFVCQNVFSSPIVRSRLLLLDKIKGKRHLYPEGVRFRITVVIARNCGDAPRVHTVILFVTRTPISNVTTEPSGTIGSISTCLQPSKRCKTTPQTGSGQTTTPLPT